MGSLRTDVSLEERWWFRLTMGELPEGVHKAASELVIRPLQKSVTFGHCVSDWKI